MARIVLGSQKEASNVAQLKPPSDHNPKPQNKEEDGQYDKGRFFKLLGGVIVIFALLIGGTFLYANSLKAEKKKISIDLSKRSSGFRRQAVASKDHNPESIKSGRDLISLGIAGLKDITSTNYSNSAPSVERSSGRSALTPAAPSNTNLIEADQAQKLLIETLQELNRSITQLSQISDNQQANNEEFTKHLNSLSDATKNINKALVAAPKTTVIASPPVFKPKPKLEQPVAHSYIVKAKAGKRTWLGKKDDNAFLLEVSKGTKIPGLGSVTSIHDDTVSRIRTIITSSGSKVSG